MPKIIYLSGEKEGQIEDKPQAWIDHYCRKLGDLFDIVSDSEIKNKVSDAGDSAIVAYDKLSEGEKDSIRKGFKELVLRKIGWVVRDCGNKALEEIHISLLSERVLAGKDGAIQKAKKEVEILAKIKKALGLLVENEDFILSCEVEDKDEILSLIGKLSIGFSEVEALKAENEALRKRFTQNKK